MIELVLAASSEFMHDVAHSTLKEHCLSSYRHLWLNDMSTFNWTKKIRIRQVSCRLILYCSVCKNTESWPVWTELNDRVQVCLARLYYTCTYDIRLRFNDNIVLLD